MELSPIEHVSKYSMLYFLANEIASDFETVFFVVEYRSTLFPKRIFRGGEDF
jgi:hypothetical protein